MRRSMVDSRRRWSFSLAQDSREARHALRQHCRAARLDIRRHQDTQHQDGDWVEQSGELTVTPYEYGLLSVSTQHHRQRISPRSVSTYLSRSGIYSYIDDVRAPTSPRARPRFSCERTDETRIWFWSSKVKLRARSTPSDRSFQIKYERNHFRFPHQEVATRSERKEWRLQSLR